MLAPIRELSPTYFLEYSISFERVPPEHWRLPAALEGANRSEWSGWPRFSVGYRHMCRWYVIGLWEVLAARGYEWVMRMDEDSRLLSPIRHDLFAHLAGRGQAFGFHMASYESGFEGERFHTFVRRFLVATHGADFRPSWLLESCGANATVADFSVRRCGQLYGFYNNFFVSSVSFWTSPDVRRFLAHVDESHTIYTRRYGDMLLQSVALQTYLPREQAQMLDEFTYEHATREGPRRRHD